MAADDVDEDVVIAWRWEQALALGLSPEDAERYALSDGDADQLRRLIRDGCDPHVAAEVLV